jgi:hypothetical protein
MPFRCWVSSMVSPIFSVVFHGEEFDPQLRRWPINCHKQQWQFLMDNLHGGAMIDAYVDRRELLCSEKHYSNARHAASQKSRSFGSLASTSTRDLAEAKIFLPPLFSPLSACRKLPYLEPPPIRNHARHLLFDGLRRSLPCR